LPYEIARPWRVTGYGCVVGNSNVRSKCLQFVQGALFGAVGVRGCKNPKALAGFTMATKDLYQTPYSTPTNEGDEDVNRIGGWDLSTNLMGYGRFPRRVGKDGCIEERSEGSLQLFRTPIRTSTEDRFEHQAWFNESLRFKIKARSRVAIQFANQFIRDSHSTISSFRFR
jgi:hypothetical protein